MKIKKNVINTGRVSNYFDSKVNFKVFHFFYIQRIHDNPLLINCWYQFNWRCKSITNWAIFRVFKRYLVYKLCSWRSTLYMEKLIRYYQMIVMNLNLPAILISLKQTLTLKLKLDIFKLLKPSLSILQIKQVSM
jgi:hypothetical protein